MPFPYMYSNSSFGRNYYKDAKAVYLYYTEILRRKVSVALPFFLTLVLCYSRDGVAQWIECMPPKHEVAGSIPATVISRSPLPTWQGAGTQVTAPHNGC
jgi:hypothetical protein